MIGTPANPYLWLKCPWERRAGWHVIASAPSPSHVSAMGEPLLIERLWDRHSISKDSPSPAVAVASLGEREESMPYLPPLPLPAMICEGRGCFRSGGVCTLADTSNGQSFKSHLLEASTRHAKHHQRGEGHETFPSFARCCTSNLRRAKRHLPLTAAQIQWDHSGHGWCSRLRYHQVGAVDWQQMLPFVGSGSASLNIILTFFPTKDKIIREKIEPNLYNLDSNTATY